MNKINIKDLLKEMGPTRKLEKNAPEGFVLVHEDTLKDLKNFDVWEQWKNDKISIRELNNKHFV